MVQGLVIKDMLSSYRPGARTGGGWIKVNTDLLLIGTSSPGLDTDL